MTDNVVEVALELLDQRDWEGLAARSADLTPDGSKTHCTQVGFGSSAERNGKDLCGMKIKQQIMQLRRIVDDWDTRPLLEDAESNLFGRLAEALAVYDYEKRHGQPPTERICLLCGKLWSECYC